MTAFSQPKRILLVTGLSGAGKSTALRTFEDMGWETVDNLPLRLLHRLLETPLPPGGGGERPLAIGIDTRTRDFDARRIVQRRSALADEGHPIELLFLDCAEAELHRRFSETRRRHPLALDRPAADGIAEEAGLTDPLRQAADAVIDTTDSNTSSLQRELRLRYEGGGPLAEPVLSIMSFGFKRGVPRNADLVFDVRFLRNPHWIDGLRPLTGFDAEVARYVAGDEAYEPALERFEDLLLFLLPRYRAEGKSYLTVAFGCTGGRHRSVHVAERIAQRLRGAGFSPTVAHRDLPAGAPGSDGTLPAA